MARFRVSLASAQYNLGRKSEAAANYQESLQLDPNWPLAAGRSAWMLATQPDPRPGDGAAAVAMAEEACRATNFRQPELVDCLAAAYASAASFDRAIETAQAALSLSTEAKRQELIAPIEQRLELYKARQPVRIKKPGH